jgi:hypothetical protein
LFINRSLKEPRLFIIRNDGTGSELLSDKQLAYYFLSKEVELNKVPSSFKIPLGPTTTKSEIEKQAGLENEKATSFITKSFREKDRLAALDFIEGIEMPIIMNTLQKIVTVNHETPQEAYQYRCLLVHPLFDEDKRQLFEGDLERYKRWKERFSASRVLFGVGDVRTTEEIEEDKKIQVKILNQRKERVVKVDQEEIKNKIVEEELTKKRLAEKVEEKVEPEIISEPEVQPIKKVARKRSEKKEEVSKEALLASNRSLGEEGMNNTGEFVSNYFLTKKGAEVPYEPLTEEQIKELLENMKKRKKGEAESKNEDEKEDMEAVDNNPIVALEPEVTMNKDTIKSKSKMTSVIKPSIYQEQMQKMFELERKEQEDAENYHISKTKDFTVYGNTRVNKPAVGVLSRPKPPVEINEQYISVDAITDRRIKTMSMSSHGYFNAPPVQTIRKQGQHQMIARALKNKQTFEELVAETNSMINYDLNDPNRRNFVIAPPAVRFGKLKTGSVYETEIYCKNEDAMPQRFTIRPPKNGFIFVLNETPGPIAQGMKATLKVEINTSHPNALGKIQDEFQLVTKIEIYKIAIFAQVLSAEEFDSLQAESFKLNNRPLLATNVREKGKRQAPAMETSMKGIKLL